MNDDYIDVLIHIRPRIGGQAWPEEQAGYPVEASLPDGSFFFGRLSLDLAALRKAEGDSEAYGKLLYEALFAGPIGRAYDLALGMAGQQTGGRLRLRLWVDQRAGELQTLRWERLTYQRHGTLVPVGTIVETPFSRYTGLGIAEPEPVDQSQGIGMFIAVSNPAGLQTYGLAPIDVERELENLHLALGDLPRRSQLSVTVQPGMTGLSAGLRQKLEADGYRVLANRPTSLKLLLDALGETAHHIFHFLGHGSFSPRTQRHALFLEHEGDANTPPGAVDLATDDRLLTGLRGLEKLPHLVYLDACESAKTAVGQAFVGLAPKLVEAGVPAVVAMQDLIKMTAAQRLAHDLYCDLLEHGLVDRALNQARNRLHEAGDDSWSIPVLFMRLRTGRLFTADPVQAALEAMAQHEAFRFFSPDEARYVPLPVEVIRAAPANYDRLESLGQTDTARIPVMKAIEQSLLAPEDAADTRPAVVVLIGDYGSNKGTQLRRLTWLTVERSRSEPSAPRLPVFVDLRNYSPVRSAIENPIEVYMLEALRPFWPDLRLRRLSQMDSRLRLRLILYGLDEMSDQDRDMAWQQIQSLFEALKREQAQWPDCHFVISARAEDLTWGELAQRVRLSLLVIQPLNHIKVRHFMENLSRIYELNRSAPLDDAARDRLDQAADNLLKVVYRSELFDLVATPRFMVEMLWEAENGRVPASRTDALRRMVDNALARVAPAQGKRNRAAETVYELAWAMQSARRVVWPLNDAFSIMDEVRGARGYDLEALYDELKTHGLLQEVGGSAMRFAYPAYQDYCCAQAIVRRPDRLPTLYDITAALGSPEKTAWWQGVLIAAAGLLADAHPDSGGPDSGGPDGGGPDSDLVSFLAAIIYGTDLVDGETLFLVGRCLLEASRCRDEWVSGLRRHALKMTRWRTDNLNEPHLSHRVQATQLLSRVAEPDEIVSLATIAYKRVRQDLLGQADYEFSSVRMAAAIGLKRLSTADVNQVLRDIDPVLPLLYRNWRAGHIFALTEKFEQAQDPGLRAMAALAMGDLASQAALIGRDQQGEQALLSLAAAFVDPGTPGSVGWALADALAMIDPTTIAGKVIRPYLEQMAARQGDQGDWIARDKRMAYLMGLARWADPLVHDFLVGHCLRGSTDMKLWLTAMDAIGRLGGEQGRQVLEEIATGKLRGFRQSIPHEEQQLHLRRQAIKALGQVGNRETVWHLRQAGLDEDAALIRDFYNMAGEIYWRQR
jgi:hypothetical protein